MSRCGAKRFAAHLGLALAVTWLAGCSDWGRSVIDTTRRMAHASPAPPTAEQVLARPYFQLQVERDGRSAVLVLGNVDGDREAWYSHDGVILFLRHGLLVKSWGLAEGNLDGTLLPTDSPLLVGLQRLSARVSTTRQVDLSPGYRYGVELQSRFSPGPLETLTILGQAHRLRRVDEVVRAPMLGWHAENRYWVDPTDGLVWKTRQTLPTGTTLTLTLLRPYREDAP